MKMIVLVWKRKIARKRGSNFKRVVSISHLAWWELQHMTADNEFTEKKLIKPTKLYFT